MVRETRTIENDLRLHEKDQGSEKRRAAEHHSGNVPPPLQSFRKPFGKPCKEGRKNCKKIPCLGLAPIPKCEPTMSASFLSAMTTRANHFAIDHENKKLKKEMAELMKEKERLQKILARLWERLEGEGLCKPWEIEIDYDEDNPDSCLNDESQWKTYTVCILWCKEELSYFGVEAPDAFWAVERVFHSEGTPDDFEVLSVEEEKD